MSVHHPGRQAQSSLYHAPRKCGRGYTPPFLKTTVVPEDRMTGAEAAMRLDVDHKTVRGWCDPKRNGCPLLGGRRLNDLWITWMPARGPMPLLLVLKAEVEEIHLAALNHSNQPYERDWYRRSLVIEQFPTVSPQMLSRYRNKYCPHIGRTLRAKPIPRWLQAGREWGYHKDDLDQFPSASTRRKRPLDVARQEYVIKGKVHYPARLACEEFFTSEDRLGDLAVELKAKTIRRPEYYYKPFRVYPLAELTRRFARRNVLTADDRLPVVDVMSELGITRNVVYKLIARGELPKPNKVGRLSRWERLDVETLKRRRAENNLAAVRFLEQLKPQMPIRAGRVRELGRAQGLSDEMLHAARRKLSIVVKRGRGHNAHLWWCLRGQERPARPEAAAAPNDPLPLPGKTEQSTPGDGASTPRRRGARRSEDTMRCYEFCFRRFITGDKLSAIMTEAQRQAGQFGDVQPTQPGHVATFAERYAVRASCEVEPLLRQIMLTETRKGALDRMAVLLAKIEMAKTGGG